MIFLLIIGKVYIVRLSFEIMYDIAIFFTCKSSQVIRDLVKILSARVISPFPEYGLKYYSNKLSHGRRNH